MATTEKYITPEKYSGDYARSTALIVRPAPLDIQRPIQIAIPARPRAPLSRMARVLIVGCIAMLLFFFGYGLAALLILGFWAIVGSATRRYEGTSERVYTMRVGGRVARFQGDDAFDAWMEKRR